MSCCANQVVGGEALFETAAGAVLSILFGAVFGFWPGVAIAAIIIILTSFSYWDCYEECKATDGESCKQGRSGSR